VCLRGLIKRLCEEMRNILFFSGIEIWTFRILTKLGNILRCDFVPTLILRHSIHCPISYCKWIPCFVWPCVSCNAINSWIWDCFFVTYVFLPTRVHLTCVLSCGFLQLRPSIRRGRLLIFRHAGHVSQSSRRTVSLVNSGSMVRRGCTLYGTHPTPN